MRKYRGLTKEGKWVKGWYFECGGSYAIIPITEDFRTPASLVCGFIEVIPETVGQFTGQLDKNSTEIYNKDKIRITAAKDMFNDDGTISMKEGEVYEDAIVSFSNGAFWLGYGCIPEKHLLKMISHDGNWRGEIIENPDLLENSNEVSI